MKNDDFSLFSDNFQYFLLTYTTVVVSDGRSVAEMNILFNTDCLYEPERQFPGTVEQQKISRPFRRNHEEC